MKVKLVFIPFHWAHPTADPKYLGCVAAIPVYDPDARERSVECVNAARVRVFNAAVETVRGRPFRGPKLPSTVHIPTARLYMTRRNVGRGWNLDHLALGSLGFRLFSVADLAAMPFACCPCEDVVPKTAERLESLSYEEA